MNLTYCSWCPNDYVTEAEFKQKNRFSLVLLLPCLWKFIKELFLYNQRLQKKLSFEPKADAKVRQKYIIRKHLKKKVWKMADKFIFLDKKSDIFASLRDITRKTACFYKEDWERAQRKKMKRGQVWNAEKAKKSTKDTLAGQEKHSRYFSNGLVRGIHDIQAQHT